jgi:CBS-domain-containing membrane protein
MREMPARALQRRRLLRRGVYLLDRHFLRRKQRYFLQAALAVVALAAVLAIESTLSNVAIVTAIASSAFIIFTVPHLRQSGPRRVLGGHAVAIIIGLIAAVIVHDALGAPYRTTLTTGIGASFAVGASMLVMAATDTEHPPAAGTALGINVGAGPAGQRTAGHRRGRGAQRHPQPLPSLAHRPRPLARSEQ